jgi:uncharacterized membrane protein YfcA
VTLLLALVAGALIGLSLGALGGGGSIFAVPVLVYALGQTPAQATTGSLVVVGITSLISAVAAYRAGNVLLARGAAFGVVAIGGAAAGATLSTHVSEPVLLAAFAVLMLVVGGLLGVRQLRGRGERPSEGIRVLQPAAGPSEQRDSRTAFRSIGDDAVGSSSRRSGRAVLDDPILVFSPTFACQCPRALKVLLTATAVGLLTGFLGVGGGFLVAPALVVALALPMRYAAGTSLVVIAVTSASALAVRAGVGSAPDWGVVLALTIASVAGGLIGAHVAARTGTTRLSAAFTVLVLVVAVYTAARALPALLGPSPHPQHHRQEETRHDHDGSRPPRPFLRTRPRSGLSARTAGSSRSLGQRPRPPDQRGVDPAHRRPGRLRPEGRVRALRSRVAGRRFGVRRRP